MISLTKLDITDAPWDISSPGPQFCDLIGSESPAIPSPVAPKLTWPRGWDLPAKPSNEAAAKRLVEKCVHREPQMFAAIACLTSLGKSSQAKRQGRRYQASTSAQIAMLMKAFRRKDNERFRNKDVAFYTNLVEQAQTLQTWNGNDEKVVAFSLEHSTGKARWVFASRTKRFALELIAARAAKALVKLAPTQFITQGGIPVFENWLEATLPDCVMVITTDIPSCFDTIKRSCVEAALPISRKVTKELLFKSKEQAVFLTPAPQGMVTLPEEHVAKVCSRTRGISQGSPPGTIAAEAVISSIVHSIGLVGESVFPATINDNLVVLLKDEKLQGAVIHALTSGVLNNFGPDVIPELTRRIIISTPIQGFDFCGRTYKLRQGQVKKSILQGRIDRFDIKTRVAISDARASKDALKLTRIRRSIYGWLRQSMLHPQALEIAAELLGCLQNAEKVVSK